MAILGSVVLALAQLGVVVYDIRTDRAEITLALIALTATIPLGCVVMTTRLITRGIYSPTRPPRMGVAFAVIVVLAIGSRFLPVIPRIAIYGLFIGALFGPAVTWLIRRMRGPEAPSA